MTKPRGRLDARIVIIGEAPTKNDVDAGHIFSGSVGSFLEQLLTEAGISVDDCYFTSVLKVPAPYGDPSTFFPSSKKEAQACGAIHMKGKWCKQPLIDGVLALEKELATLKPSVIIAMGSVALWALRGETAITKWRGSLMGNVLPTYSPSMVLKKWDWRWITIHDLKRARREAFGMTPVASPKEYLLRPSFESAMTWLDNLHQALDISRIAMAVDIETRALQIACIGIATSDTQAICIPFLCIERPQGYWTVDEEARIAYKLQQILTHPNAYVVGHNYLYDMQYLALRFGFKSNFNADTMLMHHLCFPGTQKSLDFISSLYCANYTYWKGEGKEWDPKLHDEDRLWAYNCQDCTYTYECWTELVKVVEALQLAPQLLIQMQDAHNAFTLMLRGMRVDQKTKSAMGLELTQAMIQRNNFVNSMLGAEINLQSPPQIAKVLYDVMQLPVQTKKRKTSEGIKFTQTGDAQAVEKLILLADPIYRPVLEAIVDYRSLATYKSTFIEAELDHWDGRIRCSINVAGPETFRWSSSSDAFYCGCNLQNIPRNRE